MAERARLFETYHNIFQIGRGTLRTSYKDNLSLLSRACVTVIEEILFIEKTASINWNS